MSSLVVMLCRPSVERQSNLYNKPVFHEASDALTTFSQYTPTVEDSDMKIAAWNLVEDMLDHTQVLPLPYHVTTLCTCPT
jgi:hypothetical protein